MYILRSFPLPNLLTFATLPSSRLQAIWSVARAESSDKNVKRFVRDIKAASTLFTAERSQRGGVQVGDPA
jgi:hypothetical protein